MFDLLRLRTGAAFSVRAAASGIWIALSKSEGTPPRMYLKSSSVDVIVHLVAMLYP